MIRLLIADSQNPDKFNAFLKEVRELSIPDVEIEVENEPV